MKPGKVDRAETTLLTVEVDWAETTLLIVGGAGALFLLGLAVGFVVFSR